MHEYLTGHWAASAYSIKQQRTDHTLFISPAGSFRWTKLHADGSETRETGTWKHGPDEDVLHFSDEAGNKLKSWEITYVTGCETSNMILALRWLALASPNLPILFTRIHPPDDPIWTAR